MSRLLLQVLDFGDQNRQAHTLLETFLKSGSFHLRKYTINHLRLLYRAQVLHSRRRLRLPSSSPPSCSCQMLSCAVLCCVLVAVR